MTNIIASFTSPIDIPINAYSTLWLFPLAVSISVVYKATKVPDITLKNFKESFHFGRKILPEGQEKHSPNFIAECVILFLSIVVFLVLSAVIIWAVVWLVTE